VSSGYLKGVNQAVGAPWPPGAHKSVLAREGIDCAVDAEGVSSTRGVVGDDGVAPQKNERTKEGGLVVGWKAWGGLNSALALLAWRWRRRELSGPWC